MSATCWQHVGPTNTCLLFWPSFWHADIQHPANTTPTCQQVTCWPNTIGTPALFVLCCQHVGQHVGDMSAWQTHVSCFDTRSDTPTSNNPSKAFKWKWLGRNGQKRTNALIVVQAISVLFDLFSLLYHDCILVGGSAWCGVLGVLLHGQPVAIQHDIHLMCVACTRDKLWQITFVIIQATCIWLVLMHHSMKTLLCSSFWIIQLFMVWTEIEDPLVLVLEGFLFSHSQLHSSG